MDPATFGIEQAAGGQGDAGEAFRLGLVQPRPCSSEPGKAAASCAWRCASLASKASCSTPQADQSSPCRRRWSSRRVWPKPLRIRRDSGGAVGGQFQVEHALGVARGFPGEAGMAFDQSHLPAARGEAGGAGAAGQAAADHQARGAFRRRANGAGVPGLAGGLFEADEFALGHLPFLAEAQGTANLETGCDQSSADETGAGEGGQGRLRRRKTGQFGA